MPTYNYKCSECGYEFEMILPISRMNEPTEQSCPECGSVGVKKVIVSGNAIIDPIRLGRQKPPDGFNEVLRNIAKENPNHKMNIRD